MTTPAHASVARRPIADLVRCGAEPCWSCEARPHSVCHAIEVRDLERLAAIAVVTHVAPGKTFIGEGDTADAFWNVTAGAARLYKLLPDGRRQITGFARAGDFLGLAVSAAYAFSAEAIDRLTLCRFTRRNLRALLDDFPAMEKSLLDVASNELVAAQEQMLLLGRKTARERVASFLLAQASRTAGTADRIDLPMGRGDIADYLGLTIETVSRTFSRLRTDRIVALPDIRTAVILDRKRLAETAEGFEADPAG